jgi:hypothetical protein
LASLVHREIPTNWHDRLKQIKAIRKNHAILPDVTATSALDFTSFM